MEEFTPGKARFEQNRFLPSGYTIDELRAMEPDDLEQLCETDGLDFESVVRLLGVAHHYKGNHETEIPTPAFREDAVLKELVYAYVADEDLSLGAYDLDTIPREREKGIEFEALAYKKIDVMYQYAPGTEQRLAHEKEIYNLFKFSVLQNALANLDAAVKVGMTYVDALSHVHKHILKGGYFETNTPILGRVYERVARKFSPYRASLAASDKASLGKFSDLLGRHLRHETSAEEDAAVASIMRAAKGISNIGRTTTFDQVPPEFREMLPTLAKIVTESKPRNAMSPGAIQGSEVYEAGVYADNAYRKGGRPRRLNDELGHG
jgi:hypothetical protein